MLKLLRPEPGWVNRFSDVWLWSEWPDPAPIREGRVLELAAHRFSDVWLWSEWPDPALVDP